MIKKFKKEQLLIGVLLGILFLVVILPQPGQKMAEEEPVVSEKMEIAEEDTIEKKLEEILQTISGVGQVKIFISYADHGKIVVEKDETVSEELIQEADSSGGTRTTTAVQNEKQTVYGTGEAPYVVQELMPRVEGVLVVAQGAGNVSVKKQIEETIEALFGLDAHKISIMKMEVSR